MTYEFRKYIGYLTKEYPFMCFELLHEDVTNSTVFKIKSHNTGHQMSNAFPDDDVKYHLNHVKNHIENSLIPRFIEEELRYDPFKSLDGGNASFLSDFCETKRVPVIKKVIFSNPATIVIWNDDSKTVVKVKADEEFDPWVGVAMCHMKKIYGYKFHSKFRKFAEQYEEQLDEVDYTYSKLDFVEKLKRFGDKISFGFHEKKEDGDVSICE